MKEHADGFIRNSFEDGMLLCAADLSNLQNYFDDKRRLGYRELMGHGIVFGLSAEMKFNEITINPGLAIDCQGREIYLRSPMSVPFDSLLSNEPNSGEYFLCIEYVEEFCGEAFVISEKKLYEPVHNRIFETLKLTAKNSLEDGNICIAVIALKTCDGIVRVSSVKSSACSFRFSPIWQNFLPKHRFGSVYIDKEDLPDEDGVFRTEEIFHGLGCGKDVVIKLSIKTYDKLRACEIFGDSTLFGFSVQVAAKVFTESGTFVIAVKSQNSFNLPLCVRWHACTVQEENAYV